MVMPKIFEYLGIIIRLISAEHRPIQVHAVFKDARIKIEFYLKGGFIKEIKYVPVEGSVEFRPNELKELKWFVEEYKWDIIKQWVDYFIANKRVRCEKITHGQRRNEDRRRGHLKGSF